MSYAVRNDGQGWRAVSGPGDAGPGETYSETQPEKTRAQLRTDELAALAVVYQSDMVQLNLSWAAIMRNDGATEAAKRAALDAKVADRSAKYAADRAEVITKYA